MQIVEQQFAYSEREVEGLLQLCKEMAYATEEEKMMLMCLPIDPLVVAEAKRRLLHNHQYYDKNN